MDVEAHPNDVAVARLPVGHLRIEVDVGIYLQSLERLAVLDRLLAELLLLGLVVLQGQSGLRQIDIGVVGAAVAARALPPFVIYENRAYSGFEVELVRLVADKLALSVEIYAVDTVAKQVDDISRGVAQVGLGGVAITESREEIVDFSLPVLESGLTILVPNESSRRVTDRIRSFYTAIASSLAVSELRAGISGPSDLAGRRVATVTHSAGETYLPSIGVGPVLVDNIEDAYPLLSAGDVDAVVFEAPVLQFHAAREGAGEVTTVGADFQRVQYGLMLGEDDSELQERIDLALLDLIESGIYQRLHDAWFGAQP